MEDDEITRDLEAMSTETRYRMFTDFLKTDPGNAWGWIRLSFEAEDLGRIEEAKSYLERSISINPNSEGTARGYYNLGLLLENKLNDYPNARLNYLNSIRADPDYNRPYNNIGRLLMNEFNEFPLAKEYFLEAISRWPADANLHHNLGYLYAECLQDKDQAAICLNKALELDPGNQNIKQDLDILISDQE